MLIQCLFPKQSYAANSNGHIELEDIVPLLNCQVDPFLGAPVRNPLKAALQHLSLEKRVCDVKLFEAAIRETLMVVVRRGIDSRFNLLMINGLHSDVRSWERMG